MAKFTFDADIVGQVADLMEEKSLVEVEIEHGDYSIRLSRGQISQPTMVMPAAAPQVISPAASAPIATDNNNHSNHQGSVPSPMVGTAYLSANPEAENFIKIGDNIKEGQTLMIIEAMKVMNQIPAPKSGIVKEILVADAEPVEFGQALVIIE